MRDAELGQDACLDTNECQCPTCRTRLTSWLNEENPK